MRLNMISFRAMLEGPHDGRAIADRFVAAYVAAGGDPSARNPYWDLREVAELVVDNCLVSDMAEVQDYVEDLLAELR
jgi:hypothetical protein